MDPVSPFTRISMYSLNVPPVVPLTLNFKHKSVYVAGMPENVITEVGEASVVLAISKYVFGILGFLDSV